MNLEVLWKLFTLLCKVVRWLTRRKPHKGMFLIVEDNPDDAYILERIIRKRGWECETASSVQVAEGLVKHTFYPAVFVDLRMPGVPGQALVRLLSRDAPNTHIIICCGDPRDLTEVPEGELLCLVRKPARLETIEAVLSKLKL